MQFIRNRRTRELLIQAVTVSVVAALLVAMVINARYELQVQGLTSGFGFLERSTGWDFSFSVLPYSISDSYARTLWIGILNTLFLGVTGIFFCHHHWRANWFDPNLRQLPVFISWHCLR